MRTAINTFCSGIDSSTPRAPPPITSESVKPSKSDTTVVPPPRPPRRLVRTNSEGASTRSKIEAPPVRRRESDAPEMRSAISTKNNNNDVGEPDVKLVRLNGIQSIVKMVLIRCSRLKLRLVLQASQKHFEIKL